MRDEMFAEPWLDTRPRPGSAEPELGLQGASWPHNPGSDTENARCMGLSSPPDPVPSRAPRTSAALLVGSLLYLALVGLVAAATIGVLFGAGFLLLEHHGKETIADTGTRDRDAPHPYRGAARGDRENPPAPRESAALDSAALAAPPASPLAQPAAMADVPPARQSKAAERAPRQGQSSSQPPAWNALEPEPASGSPASSASAMPLAIPAPFSVADVPPFGATKRRPTRDGRSRHNQTASRHWHPRSSHSAPTLTPPQAAQTRPFDWLLTVLTGQTGSSLTPPRAQ
jgi:hypothetical protein